MFEDIDHLKGKELPSVEATYKYISVDHGYGGGTDKYISNVQVLLPPRFCGSRGTNRRFSLQSATFFYLPDTSTCVLPEHMCADNYLPGRAPHLTQSPLHVKCDFDQVAVTQDEEWIGSYAVKRSCSVLQSG